MLMNTAELIKSIQNKVFRPVDPGGAEGTDLLGHPTIEGLPFRADGNDRFHQTGR